MRIRFRAKDQGKGVVNSLLGGLKNFRARRLRKINVSRVLDHTNNLVPIRLFLGVNVEIQPLADRISVRKIPAHKGFVDNRDLWRFLPVLIREVASTSERNVHHAEVSAAN